MKGPLTLTMRMGNVHWCFLAGWRVARVKDDSLSVAIDVTTKDEYKEIKGAFCCFSFCFFFAVEHLKKVKFWHCLYGDEP